MGASLSKMWSDFEEEKSLGCCSVYNLWLDVEVKYGK